MISEDCTPCTLVAAGGSPTINNESESELTGMQIIDNIGCNYKYGGFANELAKLHNVPKSLPYPPHV